MRLLLGDSLDILKTLNENSVDAIVTDPPYGLTFMGKKWDANVPSTELWSQVIRVLKPGGHLLSFGGTRTYHRLVVAIEDAGFEIRDQLQWIFGSGFPKSMDVSKAIDKAAGAEREVVSTRSKNTATHFYENGAKMGRANYGVGQGDAKIIYENVDIPVTSPSTDDAKLWQGFGTALKPAFEPLVLARKPLSESTVAKNVLRWNTGCLNIDAGRIVSEWENEESLCSSCVALAAKKTKRGARATKGSIAAKLAEQTTSAKDHQSLADISKMDIGCSDGTNQGNTNTSLNIEKSGNPSTDQCQMDLLSTISTRSGQITDSKTCSSCGVEIIRDTTSQAKGRWPSNCLLDEEAAAVLDKSTGLKDDVSRFFYCAKTSKAERNRGLEDLPLVESGIKNDSGRGFSESDPHKVILNQNHHPTVKPIKLMEYLIKLVTPPGGTILDPFMGSGSTGVAAKNLGFDFIGIDMNEEYVEIAKKRI